MYHYIRMALIFSDGLYDFIHKITEKMYIHYKMCNSPSKISVKFLNFFSYVVILANLGWGCFAVQPEPPRNTRYGRLAKPYPARTFTRQEAQSLPGALTSSAMQSFCETQWSKNLSVAKWNCIAVVRRCAHPSSLFLMISKE